MANGDQEPNKIDDRETSKQHLTLVFNFNYMLMRWLKLIKMQR